MSVSAACLNIIHAKRLERFTPQKHWSSFWEHSCVHLALPAFGCRLLGILLMEFYEELVRNLGG
jgi:hypothetical protein